MRALFTAKQAIEKTLQAIGELDREGWDLTPVFRECGTDCAHGFCLGRRVVRRQLVEATLLLTVAESELQDEIKRGMRFVKKAKAKKGKGK